LGFDRKFIIQQVINKIMDRNTILSQSLVRGI